MNKIEELLYAQGILVEVSPHVSFTELFNQSDFVDIKLNTTTFQVQNRFVILLILFVKLYEKFDVKDIYSVSNVFNPDPYRT